MDQRASLWWALEKCPALKAPAIDSSPAKHKPATTSAKARALPLPVSPSSAKHAFWLGSEVPPPTVPTIKFGNVTQAYNPPCELSSIRVIPTADSATQAGS